MSIRHPKRVVSFKKKMPKEAERVARGRFRERVGESPRQYENFGSSGSPVALLVFEIQLFKKLKGPNQISNTKSMVICKIEDFNVTFYYGA